MRLEHIVLSVRSRWREFLKVRMRKLYHLWLSPFSRKIRIMLAEKGLPFEPILEKPWERRDEFLALNPACEVPVLVEPDGVVLAESSALAEYIDEAYPEH